MDNTAIALLILSLAATVAAMSLPPAYPDAPLIVWRSLFWFGVTGMILSALYLMVINMSAQKFLPISIMIIGFVCLIIGGVWYSGIPGTSSIKAEKKTIEKNSIEQKSDSTLVKPSLNTMPALSNQKTSSHKSQNHHERKPPTFEAITGGKINASNLKVNGDISSIGQFAHAESGGNIEMPNVTLNIVTPPSVPFPPSTGEFSNSSNIDLSKRLEETANELRTLQAELNDEQRKTYNTLTSETLAKYDQIFKKQFAQLTISLTSETLERIHTVKTTPSTYKGGQVILQSTITENNSIAFAAEFLESLSDNLRVQ